MHLRSRLAVIFAGLVSVPLVVLALMGAAHIAYSLLAEAWYLDMFAAYGVKLLLLYTFFAAGVTAAAVIALRYPRRHSRGSRLWLFGACLAGIVAALLLELIFWSDADRLLPHGLLFVPFVGWAVVAFGARHAP